MWCSTHYGTSAGVPTGPRKMFDEKFIENQ